MKIRSIHTGEVETVRRFLRANGWAHRIGEPKEFSALVTASQRTAVAIDSSGKIVGFARSISDGISNGYLSMVVVDSTVRRKGIGRRLVEHIIGSNTRITWVLRAGREGAMESFHSLGLSISTIAMERSRA